MRKDTDGKSVSYVPPRYEYSYDFYVTIRVNNPYFDEIRFALNSGSVETGERSMGAAGGGAGDSLRRGGPRRVAAQREAKGRRGEMTLLRLMFEFMKTGLFSVGGGLATLPFLYEMSDKTGWFSHADIADMVAVSGRRPLELSAT